MQQQSLVPSAQSSSLDELIRKARRLALASRTASSIRAYGSDIRDVKAWSQRMTVASAQWTSSPGSRER